MKNISRVLVVLGLFVLAAFLVSAAQAGPYEDNKPSLNILIDKEVGVPQTNKGGGVDYTYVDNLTTSDYRFGPFATVFFRIKMKNTSDHKLENVVITDFAPEFTSLFENPGKLDGSNLKIEVGELKAGEEKEFIVKARVAEQGKLPADKGIFCVVNRVRVEAKNASDEDTSQFCVEKAVGAPGSKGGTPSTVPSAGAEDGVMLMGLSGALSYLGLKLRKISA